MSTYNHEIDPSELRGGIGHPAEESWDSDAWIERAQETIEEQRSEIGKLKATNANLWEVIKTQAKQIRTLQDTIHSVQPILDNIEKTLKTMKNNEKEPF